MLFTICLLAAWSWTGATRRSRLAVLAAGAISTAALWYASYLNAAAALAMLPVFLLDGRYRTPQKRIFLRLVLAVGFLALSEAAALTVFYVLVVSLAVRRDVKLRQLPGIVVKTVTMVGGLIVILGAALAFNSFLVDQEVPMKILRFIQTRVENRILFLITLNLFLLVVGCLLDVYSALVVIAPLIIPVAQAYQIDLLHLGVIFLANLQIGYSTPPIGMNLFIASLRFDRSILRLSRASLPFLATLLVALAIITFVPEVSLLLVR